MTQTEELVFNLCNKTFLSLWSYPNPVGKKDKELCDVLVVCEPDIIIFSIKDINKNDSGNVKTDIDRWNKRAIDESVKQIYGAERFLVSHDSFTLCDYQTQIELPDKNNRIIYRIAVCFGRGEDYSEVWGMEEELTVYNPIIFYTLSTNGLVLDSSLTITVNRQIYGDFYGYHYNSNNEMPISVVKKFDETINKIKKN